jgi:hypothetical protein
MPMFIGLNKTRGKQGRRKKETAWEGTKNYIRRKMYFSVKDGNAIALMYFGLRTGAVWRFRKVNSCLRMVQ